MSLKILSANIALGLPRMNNIFLNIRAHLVFHGWSMVVFFLNPFSLKDRPGYLDPRRVAYLKRRGDLSGITALLGSEQPDILILNELILQINKEEIERALRSFGYVSIAWGLGGHYDDATVSSLVASKLPAEPAEIAFPQESHAGGGGGAAALRLLEQNITILGVHMSVPDKFPWLFDAQMKAVADFVAAEQKSGREVVAGGDWNASRVYIEEKGWFAGLALAAADKDVPTCPTFLPFLKPLDHIFAPASPDILDVRSAAFGSDHLAVIATIKS